MRKLLLFACFCLSIGAQAQVVFSDATIPPMDKKLITGLTFPGIAGNTYAVQETNGGGSWFDGGVRTRICLFDVNTLQKIDEKNLNNTASSFSEKDYINIETIQLQNHLYSFFLNKDDKKTYPIYYLHLDENRKMVKEEKTTLQIDNTKLTIWNNKRDNAALAGEQGFVVTKGFDGKSLIAAAPSENLDKQYSNLTVVQWDADMKPVFSATYKVPMAKFQRSKVITIGVTSGFDPVESKLLKVFEDAWGYIYVLVQTADPNNKDNENLFFIYQFKKSDKNYFKIYQKQFCGAMAPREVNMQRIKDGSVVVVATGYSGDDLDRNLYKVNDYTVGEFNSEGNYRKLLGKRLSMDLLNVFDYVRDGRQEKKGYISELDLHSFKKNSDGSMYLVWEQVALETIDRPDATSKRFYTAANMLVQYYQPGGKMMWQQPIFKKQVTKNVSPSSYGGTGVFFFDDKLYVFYPDDPANAKLDIKNRDVNKFSVVKFGNKDLAGFFALQFDDKGLVKRNYLSWPVDKVGFALNMSSVAKVKEGEFIATARKLKQGALAFNEEDFTILKFMF